METLLEKISSLKILVIGDLILDHYVWGDASRYLAGGTGAGDRS